jgi:C-3',4' desaturase CrtD
VAGGGLSGLTAAALLASEGLCPIVLERNWIPGGCATSYPRKNVMFESGATTLVGLDEGMALHTLLKKLHVDIPAVRLEIPMQVTLPGGEIITCYSDCEAWIAEAERVFGKKGQREFWEFNFRLSEFVWRVSGRYLHFPPSSFGDLLALARKFQPADLPYLRYAFTSVHDVLRRYGLQHHKFFVDFCNEQLLISAQNHVTEVNALFGAAALCYTQLGNYYLQGGMRTLADALTAYIESKGGHVVCRSPVSRILRSEGQGFEVETGDRVYHTPLLFSALPLNNLHELDQTGKAWRYARYLLPPEKLYSAFQAGVYFRNQKRFSCLHHQIHMEHPFPGTGASSVFVSLSHPDDRLRCPEGYCVASVSMHIRNPHLLLDTEKSVMEKAVLDLLEQHGFFQRADVEYLHTSGPKSWEKWTGRKWGFVGGYPQFIGIKPWQMKDARHPLKGFYLCGDSVYPGQGIPGVVLSGMIAVEKARTDGLL